MPDPAREPEIVAGADAGGEVTLIDGLTLAISDAHGDMDGGADGFIADDIRHLSRLRVRVEGHRLRTLGAAQLSASTARFRGFAAPDPGSADPSLETERRRRVLADGLEEEVVVRWWALAPRTVSVDVLLDADFADIFEIRGMRTGSRGASHPVDVAVSADGLRFRDGGTGLETVVRLDPPPSSLEEGLATWEPLLTRDRPWTLRIRVEAAPDAVDGRRPAAPAGRAARPAVRVTSDPPDLGRGCERAVSDLRALSMPDRVRPGSTLLAAGIPWFVALFGRDSLIAGHQARAFRPWQMMDTLMGLAARQGTVSDPDNEEEPGKILHEVRLTPRPWLGEGTTSGARPYYGTIDATPLFLILYGEALRWGASRDALAELLPAARAALGWMRGPGDPNDDGLLEYEARGGRSLGNQGWKDSEDAVQFPDGELARGPIAMVEVQGYAHRARRELAGVLRHLGHDGEAAALEDEADALRALIRERYWIAGAGSEPGWFALALDGRGRRVDSVASNMGHLLWCDVPSADEAAQVARRLSDPAMASGWGLRTMARDMRGFNPISYHVGSVWPHDTALACEGMRRYGLDEPALAMADDLIAAMTLFGYRLPELFGGHEREPGGTPTPYPTACRPQAWAAGVPLQLATMFLGLAPDVPAGTVELFPRLPAGIEALEVDGIRLPGGRLSLRVERSGGTRILEAPAGLSVTLRT